MQLILQRNEQKGLHPEFVFVALFIKHAVRMCRISFSSVVCLTPVFFFHIIK